MTSGGSIFSIEAQDIKVFTLPCAQCAPTKRSDGAVRVKHLSYPPDAALYFTE